MCLFNVHLNIPYATGRVVTVPTIPICHSPHLFTNWSRCRDAAMSRCRAVKMPGINGFCQWNHSCPPLNFDRLMWFIWCLLYRRQIARFITVFFMMMLFDFILKCLQCQMWRQMYREKMENCYLDYRPMGN